MLKIISLLFIIHLSHIIFFIKYKYKILFYIINIHSKEFNFN